VTRTVNAVAGFDARHTSVDQVRLLLEKAESLGISSTSVLRQCKQSFTLKDLRSGRISRLRLTDFVAINQSALLEIRRRLAPSQYQGMSREDFDFMCHALISSSTVHEVLDRVCRFLDMAGRRDGWTEIETDGKRAIFSIHLGPVEEGWEFFFVANALSVFSRLLEWMMGEPLEPRFLARSRASRENLLIAANCGVSVRFSSPANQIVFDQSVLSRAIVRSPGQLRDFLRTFPFDSSLPTDTEVTLTARISAAYRDALINHRPLPTLEVLGGRMGLAPATIRRHLDEEGTSLRSIKAEVRMNFAKLYLRSEVNLDRIAALLGFSGARAFARAFRLWSGSSPSLFRCRESGPLSETIAGSTATSLV